MAYAAPVHEEKRMAVYTAIHVLVMRERMKDRRDPNHYLPEITGAPI
jgi:hypothetical protein